MEFAIEIPVYHAKYSWYDTDYEEDYVAIHEYISKNGKIYRVREIIYTFPFKTPDICTEELCYSHDYIIHGFNYTHLNVDDIDDILIGNWNDILFNVNIIMILNRINIINDIKSIIIKSAIKLDQSKLSRTSEITFTIG